MKSPVTAAVRSLKKAGISYSEHLYEYEERGGTSNSARALNVAESQVVKTLIFKDDANNPFVILMTGDKEVSSKTMARFLGVKTVQPCSPDEAQKHSGYVVGGTSPFGLRKPIPIYMEKCICELNRIYINGGKRGFLVSMKPSDLVEILSPTLVEVGL